jgi:hypothetical protein
VKRCVNALRIVLSVVVKYDLRMAHSVVIVFATSVAMLLVLSNIERRPLIRIRHDMEPLA